jgi:hypothetical protein
MRFQPNHHPNSHPHFIFLYLTVKVKATHTWRRGPSPFLCSLRPGLSWVRIGRLRYGEEGVLPLWRGDVGNTLWPWALSRRGRGCAGVSIVVSGPYKYPNRNETVRELGCSEFCNHHAHELIAHHLYNMTTRVKLNDGNEVSSAQSSVPVIC